MALPYNTIAITWPLSTISGYGVYGTQIGLQFLRRGGQKLVLTQTPVMMTLPAMTHMRMAPILETGAKIAKTLQDNPHEQVMFDCPVLHGAGNDFRGFGGSERVNSKYNIGCVAMEHMACLPEGLEFAKRYAKLIAISRWNEDYLKSLNLAPVVRCWQGIDAQLFHPSKKTGLWKDRFVIFSGGKFEFRKGQDIVLAAFKRFAAKHPEALLVCAWSNLAEVDYGPYATVGHIASVPPRGKGGLEFDAWLVSEGLQPHQFIAMPFIHNMFTPSLLWECDAAIFPNRCEGGTNLVAMEAVACGVPTYVANNTGQKDLVNDLGFNAFHQQTPVKQPASYGAVTEWGETDVDEVIAALEKIHSDPHAARAQALQQSTRVQQWDWSTQNDVLLNALQ